MKKPVILFVSDKLPEATKSKIWASMLLDGRKTIFKPMSALTSKNNFK